MEEEAPEIPHNAFLSDDPLRDKKEVAQLGAGAGDGGAPEKKQKTGWPRICIASSRRLS